MKKIITIALCFLAFLLLNSVSWAAGSCGQVITYRSTFVSPYTFPSMKVLTLTCTADSSGGTFPSIATTADITSEIKGYYITEVRTKPGTPAPQNLYDIAINDDLGIDLMGGTLADRSATLPQRAIPALASEIYGGTGIDGPLNLVITNNNVSSAVMVIKVYLVR